MNEAVKAIIKRWSTAHKIFEFEPSVANANELQAAERDLLALGPEWPIWELGEWRDALRDRGCGMCWATHSGQNTIGHGECNKKIAGYYLAKEALITYGARL